MIIYSISSCLIYSSTFVTNLFAYFADHVEKMRECVVVLDRIPESTPEKRNQLNISSSSSISTTQSKQLKEMLTVNHSSNEPESQEESRVHNSRIRTIPASVNQPRPSVVPKPWVQPDLSIVKVEEKHRQPIKVVKPSNITRSSIDPEKSLERVQLALVHVSRCFVENCTFTLCQKMKSIANHVRTCKLKNESKCSLCEQFTISCYHHAKTCTESKCLVPSCHKVREMLRLKKSGVKPPYAAKINPSAPIQHQVEPIEIEISDATEAMIEENILAEGSRYQLPENFGTPQQFVPYANILTWLNSNFNVFGYFKSS